MALVAVVLVGAGMGFASSATIISVQNALVFLLGWEIAAVGGLAVLVLARHWGNLVRLLRGTERPLGRGTSPGARPA